MLVLSAAGATGNAPKQAATPGGIDDETLRYVIEEARLNLLAQQIADLDIHLPPDKAFGFTNSNSVWQAAGRVARGIETRGRFMSEVPKLIEKRRTEVERVLGEKLPDGQALVKKPLNQAKWFVLALTNAVQQLHLVPPDEEKPRKLLARRLQKLYDQDARRRRNRGEAEPDQAWLDAYRAETEKELLASLKPADQKELIRVWSILFPDGPDAPKVSST